MGKINSERAQWAETALDAFMEVTGDVVGDDRETALGDLICDLLHLAEREKMGDPVELCNKACATYIAEKIDDE